VGNSFIGFPVPRARIADMIAGSAPPTLHKTQHQNGGDDELDLSGMEGAGGVAFPLRGIWIDDYDLDHDRVYKAYTGTGEISRSFETITLKTGVTNPSSALLRRLTTQHIVTPTWEKKRHLIFQAYFDADDRTSIDMSIFMGDPDGDDAAGWRVSDGWLKSKTLHAGSSSYHNCLLFEGAFIGEDVLTEVIHFPGEKVEYWVNGALVHTETENVPAGTADAEYIFLIILDNGATTNNVQLDFDNIQFYQEA